MTEVNVLQATEREHTYHNTRLSGVGTCIQEMDAWVISLENVPANKHNAINAATLLSFDSIKRDI